MKTLRASPGVMLAALFAAGVSTAARAAPPAPDKPAPGATSTATRPAPIKGYVMAHEHPTQGMAFGGNYAFTGAPGNFKNGIMEKGHTVECSGCKAGGNCDHGEVKGSFTAAVGALGGDMGDHKKFKGPLADSFSHLRYATDWIKAAYDPAKEWGDARMRVFVAFAVESEAMCEQVYYANKGHGGAAGYPCSKGDSLESLERQLTALKQWAKENAAWMEVAYSAADARRIAAAGKLVVVLGIESEYAFGAEDRTFDPVERLKRYYDDGVRTFYLAHKINSRLAGADIFHARDTMGGKIIRASQAISGCFYYDDNVGPFPLKNKEGHHFCDNNDKCGKNAFRGNKLGGLTEACSSKLSEISELNMADYVNRADGTFDGFAVYPKPPGFQGAGGSRFDRQGPGSSIEVERNNLGLSTDGERVVREAMARGMIVNLDHTSSNARKDLYALSKEFGGYPLNALHNSPNALLVANKSPETSGPHEYDFEDAELGFVSETGGFFGVRVGPVTTSQYPDSGVTARCPGSSTETARLLAYLLDKKLSVGYAGDYATITRGVLSRTLTNCSAPGADQLHAFDGEVAEGLSHIGMMRQWHKELETIKLKPKYLDQLKYDGVEGFLSMWDKSAARAASGSHGSRPQEPRK